MGFLSADAWGFSARCGAGCDLLTITGLGPDDVEYAAVLRALWRYVDVTPGREGRCGDPEAVLFIDPWDQIHGQLRVVFAHSGLERKVYGWHRSFTSMTQYSCNGSRADEMAVASICYIPYGMSQV